MDQEERRKAQQEFDDRCAKYKKDPSIKAIIAALDASVNMGIMRYDDRDKLFADAFRDYMLQQNTTTPSDEYALYPIQQQFLDNITENHPPVSLLIQELASKGKAQVELGPRLTGYRTRTQNGQWVTKEGCDPEKLSLEEKVLEALRDKFPKLDLSHVAYEKRTARREARFWINVVGANFPPAFPISRDEFVGALKIPKKDIERRGGLTGDQDDASFVLPEEQILKVLGLKRDGPRASLG